MLLTYERHKVTGDGDDELAPPRPPGGADRSELVGTNRNIK